ncbi:hypothetical protein BDQ12DRAFT_762472 [Crucibulum laeve]|uniref:Uncharacterized protein n=1 Tax=Crucibulum laeve TaxID=68775 RepID=A0A5C3MBW4_9AGAR|nr:hypothetical protein BDQ12DRAFT_762472 [Crucibulum laeve]
MITKQVITVNKEIGIILDVRSAHEQLYLIPGAEAEVVDLNHLAVLPGFVDVHVHLFLHRYSETPSWQDQLTKDSLAERTLRASVHVRRTLLAGFTMCAFDVDVGLRKCFVGKVPIIHGSRYYVVNRAIVLVPTGAYGPKSTIYPGTESIEGVTSAEVVDGCNVCIRAVRRQIGAGADCIKIYADYRGRSRIADAAPIIASRNLINFNDEELEATITTPHMWSQKSLFMLTHPLPSQLSFGSIQTSLSMVENSSPTITTTTSNISKKRTERALGSLLLPHSTSLRRERSSRRGASAHSRRP